MRTTNEPDACEHHQYRSGGAVGAAGAKAYLGDLAESEEDVLSYVAFPQQAEAFLKERKEKKALKVTYTIQEAE